MSFFFSSKRRHTRYWRDWSSDVCSSDLHEPAAREDRRHVREPRNDTRRSRAEVLLVRPARHPADRDAEGRRRDRKRVVKGKSVDLGGRRIIKKTTKILSHSYILTLG